MAVSAPYTALVLVGLLHAGVSTNIIEGSYKLDSSNNFENYLEELGVDFLLRTLSGLAKPVVTVSRDCPSSTPLADTGCVWKINTDTAFKQHNIQFKLGQQVDDETMDGRQVKVSYVLKGDDTLVETQVSKTSGPTTTLTRTFDQEAMNVALKVNNVAASSVFLRE